MNPTVRIIFLLLLAEPLSAQKIESWYDYQWKKCEVKDARFYSSLKKTDSGWLRSDYFVNGYTLQMNGLYEDSACQIPNGKVVFAYPNKILQQTSSYRHGKREGLLLAWYPDGKLYDSAIYKDGAITGTRLRWHHNGYLSDSAVYAADGSGIEVGWFDNGSPSFAGKLTAGYKKHGRWQYFHKTGKVSAIELYDNGRLLDKKYFDEEGSPLEDTTSNDQYADFPGGSKAWNRYLDKQIYFPRGYELVNGDHAVVVIAATVNEDGSIEDAYIKTPFAQQFDKTALLAISKSPKWIPAREHNRRVKVHIEQAIGFSQGEANYQSTWSPNMSYLY
ncbi:MAG: energy transducer TonB [Bacteroidetes bacterium]|nr:energy transducer TonB [Bacteroidota bacterium]